MIKSENHIFTGLQQDISVSKRPPECLIDAHNIRITAKNGETLLSITNEKGPLELDLVNSLGSSTSIVGTILGYSTIGQYLVLFTHGDSNNDYIYRIDMSKEKPVVVSLFQGIDTQSLGFNLDYPIETISDYENENVQKVYWTDGLNQPRVINIAHGSNIETPLFYTWSGSFDFVPTLNLVENVKVEKEVGTNGQFPAGVIQYAFTYYNKYGQETNIFKTTPLNYISYNDRGGSPEDVISLSFKITIEGIDKNFDYIRIYSILRTSLDATPICKRVQDIEIRNISGTSVSYIDTGVNGDSIDPSSLLYIGGEEVIAQSLCTKDGTLFLGNLKINRPSINEVTYNSSTIAALAKSLTLSSSIKTVDLKKTDNDEYSYASGLNTNAAGFKNREYYRLGIQAQYKNGKWSEPIFIKDFMVSDNNGYPQIKMSGSSAQLSKLVINCSTSGDNSTILSNLTTALYNAGYKKIRPLAVFPEQEDRTILCQGVVNPTMYTSNGRDTNNSLYAQSSWFFRPLLYSLDSSTNTTYIKTVDNYRAALDDNQNNLYYSDTVCCPYSGNTVLPYTDSNIENTTALLKAKAVEIQGQYNYENQFNVEWACVTMHSPEFNFDDNALNLDLTNIQCRKIGIASIQQTLSSIDIQTSTPCVSSSGAGFKQVSFKSTGANGIISGLFYDDYIVDETKEGDDIRAWPTQRSAVKWLVYPWNKNGSLNNDCTRGANEGTRTAVLSKKVISNLRYSKTIYDSSVTGNILNTSIVPQIFNSNELAVEKLGSNLYMGNIDTLLAPDNYDGMYFGYKDTSFSKKGVVTSFNYPTYWKTWNEAIDSVDKNGLYQYNIGTLNFTRAEDNIGDAKTTLTLFKEPVRMKYKSTAHAVLCCTSSNINLIPDSFRTIASETHKYVLPIVELYRDYSTTNQFGGTSQDALKANKWLPAGKDVVISAGSKPELVWEYGDTWFSRYDCLKTYPFTQEDTNQIVEIGSFELETRINIDGRYDRNRGQLDNTNMSPTNFNLFNSVYSQRDNFFTYYILDSDYYKLSSFPSQITWSLEKQPSADVDNWTSVTLASTYNMDGSKGQIKGLKTWNDYVFCFQEQCVSNILFNSRVQIQTSDGVPIEISNNYKVDGKRTIVEGAGSTNKFSICNTPSALYFIDSISKHLGAVTNEGFVDMSSSKNMTSWFNTISQDAWTPNNFTSKLFYDKCNKDLYVVTSKEALCYNEIIGQFTSFMSYENIPVMYSILDKFYCIKNNYINEMFAGTYNYFFGEYEGFDFTFTANGKGGKEDLSTLDKIYSTFEYRADKWSNYLDSILSQESPFDYIRVWNEYQDTGEVLLNWLPNKPSILKKKFRVWRVTIPRNAYNRRDRMRNTWCNIKIGAAPKYNNGNNGFVQFHDVSVQYFV